MIREHWRSVEFWRWWWHERVRFEVKAAVTVVLLALMLGGGWIAADRLSTASASVSTSNVFTFETTVDRMVTVREKGRLVRKLVPVVKKVFVKRQTKFKTLTDVRTDVIKTPGGTRTVRRKVIKLVPVVKRTVVTVGGKTKTLVTTRLVPTTNVQTQTQTETQTQTQVQVQVHTQTQTETQTNTVTDQQTVTQPAVTQTVTTTVTQVPVTVTTTVTQVPVTVTTTVTVTVTT